MTGRLPAPADPGGLVPGGERWGWECRDARLPRPVPFAELPPALEVPVPAGVGRAAERAERLSASRLAGWIGSERRLRRFADVEHRAWAAACGEAHGRFRRELAEWMARRGEYERAELAAAGSAPPWASLCPVTRERLDVFGGSARGWERLLATAGMSLVGAGLTVLDLSQDHVSRGLGRSLADAGVAARGLTLPEQLHAIDLLAGLSPEEVGSVLAEAIHAAEADQESGTASVDAGLIEHVAACLTERRVTFARLHAGVEALLRQRGPDDPAAVLTRGEYAALSDSLGEAARRSAEPRLFRLATSLRRLAALSAADESATPLGLGGVGLRVVELSEQAPELSGELLRQVLFQVMLARVRTDARDRVLMVVGADRLRRDHVERLDRLARRRGVRLVLMFRHLREDAIELLGGGEAVIVMRLGNAREAELAADFIGREHRFVASQFTVSRGDSSTRSTSVSISEGTSTQRSSTVGTQSSRSSGFSRGVLFGSGSRSRSDTTGVQESSTDSEGTSWSHSESTGEQRGTSTSEATSFQRVYEYRVTPALLQGLSPTAFVLVDPGDPDAPRLGESDPAALTDPA